MLVLSKIYNFFCARAVSQSENRAAYEFTVDFIRRTSSHIEPYIHLVSSSGSSVILPFL